MLALVCLNIFIFLEWLNLWSYQILTQFCIGAPWKLVWGPCPDGSSLYNNSTLRSHRAWKYNINADPISRAKLWITQNCQKWILYFKVKKTYIYLLPWSTAIILQNILSCKGRICMIRAPKALTYNKWNWRQRSPPYWGYTR